MRRPCETKKLWKRLPQLGAIVITSLVVSALFHALHYRFEWIEEPHFLMTLLITAYMAVYQNIDQILPDASL